MASSPDLPACAGCGQCCHLVVQLNPLFDDVPPDFVVEREGVLCMDQRGDGACVALDGATGRCSIYERRPQVCRDFQRGAALCRQIVSEGRWALSAAGVASAA